MAACRLPRPPEARTFFRACYTPQVSGLARRRAGSAARRTGPKGRRNQPMVKSLMMLFAMLLMFGCLTWAKVITGVVSDTHCGIKHDKAGDEATECVKKCEGDVADLKLVLVT